MLNGTNGFRLQGGAAGDFAGQSVSGAGDVNGDGFDGNGALTALVRVSGRGTFALAGPLPDVVGASGIFNVRYNFPERANDPSALGPLLGSAAAGVVRYTPPAAGQRVIDVWNATGGQGKVTLEGADLPTPLIKALTISPANVITAPTDAERVKVRAMTASGLFRGSFVPVAGVPPRRFTGVFLQFSGGFAQGLGCFTDGVRGGTVRLLKP